jgi:SAM-dependent methyltransferase
LLAPYYDQFVGADYNKIEKFILARIQEYSPDASLVCDLGCGSGTLTYRLLEHGYDMIGIDGSVEMLSEANNKRYEHPNGESVLFLCQQLPEFELYGTVDVILSTLDTFNYITYPADHDRLFYWLRNYLNPNGLLIFDVNTQYKYQELLDRHCEVYEEDDVYMVWHSQFDGTMCQHTLTFFEKDGEHYYRSDEEQQQRYYSVDEIRELLLKYGFKLLEMRNDYSECTPDQTTQRITFVSVKDV